MENNKPKFYLKILNGYNMAFGVQVFLSHDREHEIFSQYTSDSYDNRRDLFQKFIENENLGLLKFTFDIYHQESYINMRWLGEKEEIKNFGRQDCRNWIWEDNKLRSRVMSKNSEDDFSHTGSLISK